MSETTRRRTSTEIRDDIGRTRLGLDFMIDALEGRLSMGSLIDEAMGMLRGPRGGTGEAPIGALIRDHPGPAALITAGVVWLAIENRRGAEPKKKSSRSKSGAKKASTPRKRAPSKTTRKKTGSES